MRETDIHENKTTFRVRGGRVVFFGLNLIWPDPCTLNVPMVY